MRSCRISSIALLGRHRFVGDAVPSFLPSVCFQHDLRKYWLATNNCMNAKRSLCLSLSLKQIGKGDRVVFKIMKSLEKIVSTEHSIAQ